MIGVSASPTTVSSLQLKLQIRHCCLYQSSSLVLCPPHDEHTLFSSDLKLKGSLRSKGSERWSSRTLVRSNSSIRPGGPNPGENDSKNVLDAFFLGKALAEALNERIESAVGEFLSSVGRLQAEQQKQVQELQEEVFERAKKAKERAAREAMEEQGVIPNSSVINASADTDVVAPSSASSSTADAITTETIPTDATAETDPDPTNPVVEVSIDD